MSRRNPLIGYKTGSMGNIDKATRVLFSPNAPKLFTEKFKHVPLNLVVIAGEANNELVRVIEEAVDKEYTVLWMNQSIASSFPDILQDLFSLPRGHSDKPSAMTPFTVLHRMWDEMIDNPWLSDWRRNSESLSEIQHVIYDYQSYTKRLLKSSRDVPFANTLAGRSNWIKYADQSLAEVWAKFLLTGKVSLLSSQQVLDLYLPEERKRDNLGYENQCLANALIEVREHLEKGFRALLPTLRGVVIPLI